VCKSASKGRPPPKLRGPARVIPDFTYRLAGLSFFALPATQRWLVGAGILCDIFGMLCRVRGRSCGVQGNRRELRRLAKLPWPSLLPALSFLAIVIGVTDLVVWLAGCAEVPPATAAQITPRTITKVVYRNVPARFVERTNTVFRDRSCTTTRQPADVCSQVKTCSKINTCAEAYYRLMICKHGGLDGGPIPYAPHKPG
jgi:hypothetical protein